MVAKPAIIAACLVALWFPAGSGAQSRTPDLAQAESLVRDGRAAEAYALLQPFEAEAAGNADFDYWLGVAALEAGKPDKASIALERAVISNPDFVGARLDLARAYFELKDFQRARTEFNTVLEQDPPPAARATADRYISEIESRLRAKRTIWSAYLDATIGRDTNVNNSTRDSTLFVPLFGLNLALAPTSVKAADNYLGLGGGLEVVTPLTDEVSAYAGTDYRQRVNQKQDTFDYNRLDGHVGLQYAKGDNLYRATVSYGRFDLDHNHNYDASGVALEWRHAVNERTVLNLTGVGNRLRFADPALQGNNVNQAILGAGWAHAFNAEGTTFVFGTFYSGREHDTDNRVDGSRKLSGFRLVGQYGINATWQAYASVGVQISDYDTENFVFQATRKDRMYEAALGLSWHPQPGWTVRPQIAYSQNQSNIVIYEYDRFDISVTLRRDFR